jgi:hypothetical protein
MDYIVTKTKKELSQKKLYGLLKLAEIINFGRKSPVKFCEIFFGISFLDSQKYAFQMSWTTPFNVWCQSRNSGKTTMLAPFIMAKSVLIPNFQTYIMSAVSSQSQEAFLKIEKIAKKEIASFTGLTDVFFNETVKSVANKDGFTHNPQSYRCTLYHGSQINSLNGAYDSNRGKRSNLNVYDEAGFASDELFEATMPFITQNSDFKLGGNIDLTLQPKEFPNQVIFASSASSIDTYFYRMYRDYAKKMFLGDKRYFVIDINAKIVMNATFNGKKYPTPLLSQSVIDGEMAKNKEKGLREYMNIFSREGGETQAVKRATIIKNSISRPPVLVNNNKNKYVLAYDPARSYDNSVVLIGEIYHDDDVGYKMNIVNSVSFSDIAKKKKTPIRTPEQIELLKQMILDYNGLNAADYENIEALMIDAGAGGGGVQIADYLMEDWLDKKGKKHKGLIDRETSSEDEKKFPNAVDKLRLIVPRGNRTPMFDAMVEMTNLDLVSFTAEYDMKGFINLFENIEVKGEDGKKELEQKSKMYKLSEDEEFALKSIDLTKEEIVNIHKFKSDGGTYKYALSADKKNKLNDDRGFCYAMLCWYLQEKRREDIVNKKPKKVNWGEFVLY